MNIKSFLCTLIILISGNLISQTTISEIDERVSLINKDLENYEKTEKIDTSRTQKFFYFDDNKLRVASFKAEGNIEKNTDYYFLDEQLIFTVTKWIDTRTGKVLYNEKTYHRKGELFAWLNTENTFVDARTAEFKKKDLELRSFYGSLFKESDQ